MPPDNKPPDKILPNPKTASEWRERAKKVKLDPDDILVAGRSYHSASKLTLEEFLYFKVLWGQGTTAELDYRSLVSPQVVKLVEDTDFSGCGAGTNDPHDDLQGDPSKETVFTISQYFMHLIKEGYGGATVEASPKIWKMRLRTERKPRMPYNEKEASNQAAGGLTPPQVGSSSRLPGKGPAITPPDQITSADFGMSPAIPEFSPRTEYEVTVNMALVALLSAIRLRCLFLRSCHWLADQKPLYIFDTQGKSLLEARVDGYLKKLEKPGPFGILEVKPYVREEKKEETQWQEAAQMVAWISMTPGKDANGVFNIPGDLVETRRRFMISQDRDEIYVTIATYDDEYETFLVKRRSQMSPRGSTTAGDGTGASTLRPAVAKYGSSSLRYRRSQGSGSPTRRVPGAASLTKSMNSLSLGRFEEESDSSEGSDVEDSDEQIIRKTPFPLLSKGGPRGGNIPSGKTDTTSDPFWGEDKSETGDDEEEEDDGSDAKDGHGSGLAKKRLRIKPVKGFLKIVSFGPFHVDVPSHMVEFCKMTACLTKAVLDPTDHAKGKGSQK